MRRIGDISRFEVEAKLAQYVGLTWRTKQSGNFRAEETFMTKTGNVYLLRGHMIAAQSMINQKSEGYGCRKVVKATTGWNTTDTESEGKKRSQHVTLHLCPYVNKNGDIRQPVILPFIP